ncbi:MAG: hypothetical protein IKP09_08775 [Lentisphaeria bacterium]|jgi:hypothetical protein|nr:hypothetical protein [Lentisphaeria bacterium]
MATYDVKDVNGVEHLKIEESDVAALVESDQLTATCPMKKSLMPSWSTAAKFDFITNLLDEQRKRIAMNAAQARSDSGMFSQKELTDQQKIALAEEEKFVAKPAAPAARLKAFFIDFVFALFKAVPLEIAAIAAVWLLATLGASDLPKPTFPADPQIKTRPTTFAALDTAAGFHAGSLFTDEATKTQYICLSAENGKAVWIDSVTAGRIAAGAALLFFAWEFAMLGWGLCAHGQTRGMKKNELTLCNAKDIRVELNGFQVFASVLVTLMTYSIAWIFVLAIKRSPAELVSFTRCTAE